MFRPQRPLCFILTSDTAKVFNDGAWDHIDVKIKANRSATVPWMGIDLLLTVNVLGLKDIDTE